MVMLNVLLLICALTAASTSYNLCSCCSDPLYRRGLVLDQYCVHALQPPSGQYSSFYSNSLHEHSLVLEYMRDYAYYDGVRYLKLNDTIFVDTVNTQLIKGGALGYGLFYAVPKGEYHTYEEDRTFANHDLIYVVTDSTHIDGHADIPCCKGDKSKDYHVWQDDNQISLISGFNLKKKIIIHT